MKYAVNYIDDRMIEFLTCNDIYIKYPGKFYDLDTLKKLVHKTDKVILHGIIPSSGSIADPHLCDEIEEYSKLVTMTKQKWLSFHLDYKKEYMSDNYIKTIEENVSKLKEIFNIDILLENVPSGYDAIELVNPEYITKIVSKYNCGFLLDIPHAIVAAKNYGYDVYEYIDKLPLNKVKEIHISGFIKLPNGKYTDGHGECIEDVYEILKYVLSKTKCELIALEYTYDKEISNLNELINALKITNKQMEIIKEIVKNSK